MWFINYNINKEFTLCTQYILQGCKIWTAFIIEKQHEAYPLIYDFLSSSLLLLIYKTCGVKVSIIDNERQWLYIKNI